MRTAVMPTMAVLVAAAVPASAAEVLAVQPAPAPSIWAGWHVGTEVVAVSGGWGTRGGFGAAVDVGYDRAFANHLVLGVEGATGYTPFSFANSRHGFDFARLDGQLGYDMGRVMPFVTAGVVVLKPDLRLRSGSLNAGESLNALVNGTANAQAAATVGAGVDYALTNNLHVGVAVSVTQVPALLAQ